MNRRSAIISKMSVILCACLCAGSVARAAQTKIWIGGASGNWDDASNWEVLCTSSNNEYVFTNAVTFADGNTGSNYIRIHLTNSTARLDFRGGGVHLARMVYLKNGGELHIWDKGCFDVEHSNGEIYCDASSKIVCHDEDVLPPSLYKISLDGTLDLGGFNQTITYVGQFAHNVYGMRITSARPAMLSFCGSIPSIDITGYLQGLAGICWKPSNSAKKLTFYNYTNTTEGELVVSNGIVTLNTGSYAANLTQLSRAEVASGAMLEIPVAASISKFYADHLVLHEGSTLTLGANATSVLPRVTFVDAGGAATDLPDGLYGASSGYGCLTGSGFVRLAAEENISRWTAAADGHWGAVANWSDCVPSATVDARIDVSGGDYEVTVAEPAVATNLTLRNLGAGTATLNVASRLESTRGEWRIGYGGKVVVPAGGEIQYRGIDASVTDRLASSVEAFKTVKGGEIEVQGKLYVTNMCGNFVVGDADAATSSKISVSGNGELFLGSLSSINSSFSVRQGGLIEVSGDGKLRLNPRTEHYSWQQAGGTLDFSDNATYDGGGMWDYCLGQGRATFRDDAKFVGNATVGNGSARLYFTSESGAPTEVWFRDRAVYSAGGSGSQTLLRSRNGGRIEMHFDSSATHYLGYLIMGRSSYAGFSDIYVSDGILRVNGSGGLNQGSASAYWANSYTTGCVHQTGGAIVVNGEDGYNNAQLKFGFILGDGLTSATLRAPTAFGRFELSGGVVTNESSKSPFVLGIGRGRGEFVQTGGEFVSLATHAQAPAIFGFSNGYGYYVLSNGTAKVSSKVWVGGIDPATCGHDAKKDGVRQYTGTAAEGGITVAAADRSKPCSFTALDTVVLGGLGEGSLEVGPGGTFAGTDLVLSNNTASVLKFHVTNDGAGFVGLSGKLTITDGASLVIDATDFTDTTAKRRMLLQCASIEGGFAPGKMMVVSDRSSQLALSVTSTGIRFGWHSGMIISFR